MLKNAYIAQFLINFFAISNSENSLTPIFICSAYSYCLKPNQLLLQDSLMYL